MVGTNTKKGIAAVIPLEAMPFFTVLNTYFETLSCHHSQSEYIAGNIFILGTVIH